MTTDMQIGHHYFDGACAPKDQEGGDRYSSQTFSVGIFEWVPASSKGKGAGKRSPVKVRVWGYCDSPKPVYDKALAIATELDAGTYTGPKRVQATR